MTILYVIGAVLVGWVIGFLDSNMRTSKKIEAAEARAQVATTEAEKKIAAAESQMSAAHDDPGVLRMRNLNGTPALELDGSAVDAKAVSPDQRRRLIELLNAIRPWVEAGVPAQTLTKPVVQASAPPAPAAPLPAMTAPVVPAQAAKAKEEKDLRLLSIVAQIDTVLQKNLSVSALAGKGIRLSESSIGGVEVYVGVQKYSSVDEVPDAFIQSAIRAAIAEWEKNYTPGR